MATEPDSFAPLRAALGDVLAWWGEAGIEGIFIGGVAASLLGRPRVTRDVDALVWLDEARWSEFLANSARFGFAPRTADPLRLAREARVLLLRHAPSQIDVDVAFASLPFERETLDRSIRVEVSGQQLPLPTPEDLIIMKAVAHRPRDLADVEGLLDAHPRLDRRRIRRYLRSFATLLEMPEVLSDVEALLRRRKPRR